MSIKQVIVMRKDLKMRRGKEIAQGSHASMVWIVERIKTNIIIQDNRNEFSLIDNDIFNYDQRQWLNEKFTKICLQVNSEEELDEIYEKAKQSGLEVHMIVDSGVTEFNKTPTKTCLAIGPHESDKIDSITGNLKLY